MNRELLSVVVHTAPHAWQSGPSQHAEVGEHVATAAMHADDGTVHICSVTEIRRPPRWPINLQGVIGLQVPDDERRDG